MKKTIIEVKDLKKDFHVGDITVHALRGINLEIKEGEFVAIMGTSGSGKSTMLNVLGCLDKPTSGSYLLDGVSMLTDSITSFFSEITSIQFFSPGLFVSIFIKRYLGAL